MRNGLALALLMLGTATADAARIDDGPEVDIGRYLGGCWVNEAGTFAAEAGSATICFADGVVDAGDKRGTYAIRGEQLVLTGPTDTAWAFSRPNVVCDVGVKPLVRLGLFDCVGTGGASALPTFLPDLLFTAKPAS